MNKSFTTGDIVRFESGTMYRVLGYEGGMLQVRGQRRGQDFGAVRLIDPNRTELVSSARQVPAPVEAPAETERQQEAPAPAAQPEPAPVTGSIPVIVPRTDYWDLDTYQHASQAARETVDAVFAAVEEISLPYLSVGLDHKTYSVTAQFSVPGDDPAFPTAYLVGITDSGELIRLARLVWTGEWTPAGGLMDPEPKTHWRTVGRFVADRVGKVLARDAGLAQRPQLPRWGQAGTR